MVYTSNLEIDFSKYRNFVPVCQMSELGEGRVGQFHKWCAHHCTDFWAGGKQTWIDLDFEAVRNTLGLYL